MRGFIRHWGGWKPENIKIIWEKELFKRALNTYLKKVIFNKDVKFENLCKLANGMLILKYWQKWRGP